MTNTATRAKPDQKERELALVRKFLEQIANKAASEDRPMSPNRLYYLAQEVLKEREP